MLPIIVADTAFEREHFALLTQIFGEGLEDYSTFTRLIGYTPAAVRALFELPEFEREVRRVRLGFLSPENATQRLRRKCDVLLENEILPRAPSIVTCALSAAVSQAFPQHITLLNAVMTLSCLKRSGLVLARQVATAGRLAPANGWIRMI